MIFVLFVGCCEAYVAQSSAWRRRGPSALRVMKYTYGSVPSQLDATDKAPLPPLSFDEGLVLPDWSAPVFAAVLLGFALYLGPDWVLAPLGLESGIRPGRATEVELAKVLDPDSDFVAESEAGFAASPSLAVLGVGAVLYVTVGFVAYEGLVRAFDDDAGFVCALATCAGIAGGVYEIGRPKPPTRSEADAAAALNTAFLDFAEARLERRNAGSVHKSEIVRAFRRSFARYRTAEGSGVSDRKIEKVARQWYGRPVSPAGYLKGCALKPEADVY